MLTHPTQGERLPMNSPLASDVVLVLWGRGCDEVVATYAVTAFRQQGVNVSLVGISGRQNSGAYGLTLQPDLFLGDALPLADQGAFVVLPCATNTLIGLDTDPRLRELIQRAVANDAHFLVCETGIAELLELDPAHTHLIPVGNSTMDFLHIVPEPVDE